MVKDSSGHIGFVFKDGKITAIVKDSSAARNGVLTDHQLVEINGQNCVGVKVGFDYPICVFFFFSQQFPYCEMCSIKS